MPVFLSLVCFSVFFWLLLFCLCLPGCFSISFPVFPCLFFSSCLSLCLDALSTFLLPLCTSLPQVLSVCWYVFRLYVFRYVFRQTVVLTVGLHPAFFLSISLLLLSLHPSLSVPVCISLCPLIGLFLGLSACLLFFLCLLPMTPDPLFRFLFEYLSLFNCSFLVLGLSLCPLVWLWCCMASCFLVSQPLGASFFLFICFFVSVSSSSFYLCLSLFLFLSCQFLSIPVCLSVCALAIYPVYQPVSPLACFCLLVSLSACIHISFNFCLSNWLSFSPFLSFSLPPSVSDSPPLFAAVSLSVPSFLVFWSMIHCLCQSLSVCLSVSLFSVSACLSLSLPS